MLTRQRSYAGEIDKREMTALVEASPNSNLHVADLPYRLSSWAFDVPENARLWFNQEDGLIAWAVLQSPFWTIDYAYSTETDCDLHREILTWADRRARKILGSAHGHPTWFINVFAEQTDRIRDLADFGFASQANIGEDSWSKVLMTHSAKTHVSACPMPSGFAVRPLAGEQEIEAYVKLHQTAFESKNMTADWRLRTLHHPGYRNDLDLVVIAPNGQMVTFCVCWLNMEASIGQIEPLGVHDDFRQLGLGRAILAEGIHRLVQSGATRLFVETDSYRNAAFALYESAGFRVEKDVLVFRKDYDDGQALAIRRETDDQKGIVESLFNIGTVHQNKKGCADENIERALGYFEEAYQLAEEGGFRWEKAHVARHLGYIYGHQKGDLSTALSYHRVSRC